MVRHFAILRLMEYMSGAGCCVCRAVDHDLRRSVSATFYESVNDVGTREQLIRSLGYCRWHAPLVRELAHALGAAIMLRSVVDHAKERLTSRRNPKPIGECPICVEQSNLERQKLELLRNWFDDEQVRSAFDASDGLCFPHFSEFLELIGQAGNAYLIADMGKRLDRISAELSEAIRKADYRFAKEPHGSERDAWIRALKLMSGSSEPI
jgi:hypothetical protein